MYSNMNINNGGAECLCEDRLWSKSLTSEHCALSLVSRDSLHGKQAPQPPQNGSFQPMFEWEAIKICISCSLIGRHR